MKLFVVLAWSVAVVITSGSKCIVKPYSARERIINGQDASKGEAPYIVSLRDDGEHFCGGSIIDKHWVLTAAHCLACSKFDIIAGLHKQDDLSNVQIRRISSLKCLVVNEGFGTAFCSHDIGLIYIKRAFEFNVLTRDGSPTVTKISLGPNLVTGDGKVYGWGINRSGNMANTLQALDVNIISYQECKTYSLSSAPLYDHNICTYKPGASDGSCTGDSGGPLIRHTSSDVELVGVVSSSPKPCHPRNLPTVYISVIYFKEWIENTMESFKVPTQCTIL